MFPTAAALTLSRNFKCSVLILEVAVGQTPSGYNPKLSQLCGWNLKNVSLS